MSWFAEAWEVVKRALNPETIIQVGGLPLLSLVVFAETGLLVGFFLPGDSLLFIAGLLTATGLIPYPIYAVAGAISLAAILGDQLGYFIGRRYGPRIFRRKESWLFKPEYVRMTKAFYDRHGGKALILGKFVPIVRTFAPVMAGVAHLDYKKFTFYNVTGGLAWGWSIPLVGYFLGRIFPNLGEYLEYIVIGLVVLTAIPVIRTFRQERKNARQEAAEQAALAADLQSLEAEKQAHDAEKAVDGQEKAA